jgi:hypothetical protein
MSGRKKCVTKLFLVKLAQKITLVLVAVAAAQQPVNRPSGSFNDFPAAIVSGGYIIGPELPCFEGK